MREYEVVYIFRPDLESDEVEERLERYHDRLGEGEVTAVEHWGQRQLAYEIRDERKGYYVVVQFRTEPGSLTDFEQGLRHDEDLLRHLVVLSEGELPIPPSQRGEEEEDEEAGEDEESGSEEDEEDEDEDEAEESGDEDDDEDDDGPREDAPAEEDEADEDESGTEEDDGEDEAEEEGEDASDDEEREPSDEGDGDGAGEEASDDEEEK